MVKKDIPEITGMRGVAALFVVIYHTCLVYNAPSRGETSPGFLNFGWIGVDFFFVLSAFLLSLPLLGRTMSVTAAGFWKAYVGKRLLRIAPPYYASIVISLLLMPSLSKGAGDVISHVAYAHIFDFQYWNSVNPVFWTLAIEFQLYVLLPILVLLLRTRAWALWLAVLTILTLAWRTFAFAAAPGDPERVFWLLNQFPAYLAHFALGVVAARAYIGSRRLPARAVLPSLLVTIGLMGTTLYFLTDGGVQTTTPDGIYPTTLVRPLLGLLLALLIYLVLQARTPLGWFLSAGPTRFLGTTSYSLYLFHVPMMAILYVHVPTSFSYGLWPAILAVVAISIVGAAAGYAVFEKPCFRLKNRLFSRIPSPAGIAIPRPPDVNHPVSRGHAPQ